MFMDTEDAFRTNAKKSQIVDGRDGLLHTRFHLVVGAEPELASLLGP